MGRVLAGTLLVFFALAGSAWAADTTVGSGTTAWGDAFTLRVTEQKTPVGPARCLEFEDADGGGAGCPLARPPLDHVDVQTDASCGSKHVAIYGALDARVARVIVRLVGGRTLVGTRFDPVPAVDPRMAYWIVTFKGLTSVRSITAVGADGSVLARDQDALTRPCEMEPEFHGRRYPVALVTDPDGIAWRVEGYRGLIRDDGRLRRTHCFDLRKARTGEPLVIDGSGSCGIEIEAGTKALAVVGDASGCGASTNLILYGLARANVARIVVRSKAGWTVTAPRTAPRGLRTAARVWAAAVRWPASGVVIDAQDRFGRTIAKDRLEPLRIPGVACPGGSIVGTI